MPIPKKYVRLCQKFKESGSVLAEIARYGAIRTVFGRPQHPSEARPMTNEEWRAYKWEKLSGEISGRIKECRRTLKQLDEALASAVIESMSDPAIDLDIAAQKIKTLANLEKFETFQFSVNRMLAKYSCLP